MTNTGKEEKYTLTHILIFIWKWRIFLGTAFLVSVIAGIIIVNTMKPVYRSYFVVFPSRSNQIDRVLYDDEFGYDIHAEWLYEIIRSQAILDSLDITFRLAEHYGLDRSKPSYRSALVKKYYANVKFERSVRYSVVVSVKDHDPEIAAAIANEIIRLTDVMRASIISGNREEAIRYFKTEYDQRTQELEDFEKQTETAQAAGNQIGETVTLGYKKMRFLSFDDEKKLLEYEKKLSQYYDAKYKYETALRKFDNSIPHIYVVDKAVPDYRKISPRYSVILPLVTGSCMMVAVLLILFIEQVNIARQQIKK